MALLDMTDVITDPDLATAFDVIRRNEVIGENGRPKITSIRIDNQIGVICAKSGAMIVRAEDNTMMSREIAVVTPFGLRGPGKGYQPDIIVVMGILFTITEILPFSNYGAGFTEALASSQNATDPSNGPVIP